MSEIERMCESKRVYPTKQFAQRMVLEIYGRTRKMMRAYECPHCKKFHLTKQV